MVIKEEHDGEILVVSDIFIHCIFFAETLKLKNLH